MKNELTNIINIGKDTRKKLEQTGIDSFAKFKETGSEDAFIRVQTIDPRACLSLLYGLEGAMTGTKWNELPEERKKALIDFFRMVKKKS
jgi:DNA transformation protein